jgi:hypothetical protein
LAVLSELECSWQTSFWAHWDHVVWVIEALSLMSHESTSVIVALFIEPSLAVRGVASESGARSWAHGFHVICVTFIKVCLVVTELIGTFFILPGLTVLSESERFW